MRRRRAGPGANCRSSVDRDIESRIGRRGSSPVVSLASSIAGGLPPILVNAGVGIRKGVRGYMCVGEVGNAGELWR